MRKTSPIYAFIDPSSGGYSASRTASLWLVIVDTIWMIVAILGLPPKEAYTPVSAMLSACTVASFGAYAANSYGRFKSVEMSGFMSGIGQKLPTRGPLIPPQGE